MSYEAISATALHRARSIRALPGDLTRELSHPVLHLLSLKLLQSPPSVFGPAETHLLGRSFYPGGQVSRDTKRKGDEIFHVTLGYTVSYELQYSLCDIRYSNM